VDWSQIEPQAQVLGCHMRYVDKFSTTLEFLKVGGRNVALGNGHNIIPGTDTAAPTVQMHSILLAISLAAFLGFDLKGLDFSKAYLNATAKDRFMYGTLDKNTEILVKEHLPHLLPRGTTGKLVFRIEKSMYGLKTSAMEWSQHLNKILIDMGFTKSLWDASFYYKLSDGVLVIMICVYVDDLLVACSLVQHTKFRLELKRTGLAFKISNDGVFDYLGFRVQQDLQAGTVTLDQPGFLSTMLDVDFGLSREDTNDQPCGLDLFSVDENSPLLDAKRAQFFHSITMKMNWVARIRFEIKLAVSFLVTRTMAPTEQDLAKLQRLARYLNGSRTLPLRFSQPTCGPDGKRSFVLQVSADASFQPHADMSSHLAFVIYVPGVGTIQAVSTLFRGSVPQSSTEAELEALCIAMPALIPLRGILAELLITQGLTIVEQDNKSAILIVRHGPGRTKGSRPMRRRVFGAHFMLGVEIELKYTSTEVIKADPISKPASKGVFERSALWIQNIPQSSTEHELAGSSQ
jgi:hypothetical protein